MLSIKAPGATGLITNFDYDMLKPTDALKLQNTTVTNRYGRIERQKVLVPIGTGIADNIYSADSYYDTYENMTQLVGLTGQTSTIPYSVSGTYASKTISTRTHSTDQTTVIGYSDQNDYNIGTSYLTDPKVVGKSVKFLDTEFGKIIYNINSIPYMYTPFSSFRGTDPHKTDTSGFLPRLVAVSLEAPGQPRVSKYPTASSDKEGWYRYIYSYGTSYAYRSAPTRWIYLNNESAMISLFEINGDTTVNMTVHINRQRYNGVWRDIGTLTMFPDDVVYYIDSSNNSSGTEITTFTEGPEFANQYGSGYPHYFPNGGTGPGALNDAADEDATFGDPHSTSTDLTVTADYYYYVCYSYYDPITGQESPLGPANLLRLYTNHGSGTRYLQGFRKAYTKFEERPSYIRLYRSIDSTNSLTSDPTFEPTDWYCMAQLRANDCYHYANNTNTLILFPGWGSTDQLTQGMIIFDTLLTNAYPYQNDDIVFSDEGGPLIRPPVVENLEVSFTSMVYSNNRYWGVGDEKYPSRLYYSNYDTPYEWSFFNSLELFNDGNSDKLVSLQTLPAGSQQMLYAFKHNSIYGVSGYDAEYDLSIFPITTEIGAVNSNAVISAEDIILFLAPDLDIYALSNGAKPQNITKGIHNELVNIFNSFDSAKVRAIAYRFDDYLCFTDTSNADTLLAYDLESRTWTTIGRIENVDVVSTFQYDTLGVRGENNEVWWSLNPLYSELLVPTTGYRQTGIGATAAAVAFEYRTPYITADDYMIQVEQIDFTAYWGSGDDLTLRIIDQDGDTLATETITYSAARNNSYSIGMPVNEGQHLAIDFSTAVLTGSPSLSADSVWISDIDVKWRRIGKNAID